jgi:phosphatidylglycerophosphatase C
MLAYASNMISADKAKEELLSFYVSGIKCQDFKAMGSQYSRKRLPKIVGQDASKRIRWHQSQGHTVAVVSASMEYWLEDWCKENDLDLIATRLEVKNERVTGKFASRNCSGREKIARITETALAIRRCWNLQMKNTINGKGQSDKRLEFPTSRGAKSRMKRSLSG